MGRRRDDDDDDDDDTYDQALTDHELGQDGACTKTSLRKIAKPVLAVTIIRLVQELRDARRDAARASSNNEAILEKGKKLDREMRDTVEENARLRAAIAEGLPDRLSDTDLRLAVEIAYGCSIEVESRGGWKDMMYMRERAVPLIADDSLRRRCARSVEIELIRRGVIKAPKPPPPPEPPTLGLQPDGSTWLPPNESGAQVVIRPDPVKES